MSNVLSGLGVCLSGGFIGGVAGFLSPFPGGAAAGAAMGCGLGVVTTMNAGCGPDYYEASKTNNERCNPNPNKDAGNTVGGPLGVFLASTAKEFLANPKNNVNWANAQINVIDNISPSPSSVMTGNECFYSLRIFQDSQGSTGTWWLDIKVDAGQVTKIIGPNRNPARW